MTIRTRIAALVIAAAAATAAMLAVALVALALADQVVTRVDAVQRRLEVMADLDGRVSTYGKRVGAVLLIGRSQMPLVQAARIDIERTFALLTRVTRAELATLSGMSEVQGQLPELEDVRRMIELYHAIDVSAAKALAMSRDGDTPGAVALYEREVTFRLDNELQPLIDGALTGERREVADQLERLGEIRGWLLPLAVALGLLGLVGIVLLGWRLRRALLAGIGTVREQVLNAAEGRPSGEVKSRLPAELSPLTSAIADLAARLDTERRAAAAGTDDLETANARLSTIDAAQSALLAEIGHELRTPLTVLRGEADVALRGAQGGEALREALERIRGQSAELALLLDDMLAMVGQDPAGQPFERRPTGLADVVAAAVDEARLLAVPREVSIVAEAMREPAIVLGDFRRLKQAVMIGLDNAIKHSPPGGIVTISLGTGDSGGARISVRDDGPGVAEDDLPQVFERFYRGKGEREMFNQGLGIGLAIARDIVLRHAGRIALANRPEGGAELCIDLPLREVVA